MAKLTQAQLKMYAPGMYRIIKPDGRIRYAGTDMPSWFKTLDACKQHMHNGDTVYQYNVAGDKLWEVLV
jgi:hypothetical protein